MARTLSVLELLARHGPALELATISERLNIPRSGVHRLLAELTELGYVRQVRELGEYTLTTKLMSLGLMFLSNSGIVDVAQPLLNELAEISGELVRLSVVDSGRLTWVARAQGARRGLRYDPDMGTDARLSCTSSGWAWLSTWSDDEATVLVARQGLGSPREFGPQAPANIAALLEALHQVRLRGVAITEETYTPGLNAVSAPVRVGRQPALGVLTIAGPTVRLTRARMEELAPQLTSFAEQLAAGIGNSPFFNPTPLDGPGASGRKPVYAL